MSMYVYEWSNTTNNIGLVTNFILKEGALLAVLFFLVAFAVAMLQQSVGQKINNALAGTSLEKGVLLAATAAVLLLVALLRVTPELPVLNQCGYLPDQARAFAHAPNTSATP